MKKTLLGLALAGSLLGAAAHAEVVSFNTVDYAGKLTAEEPDFNKDIAGVAKSIDAWKLADVKINAIITPNGDNASFDYGNIVYIPRSMQFSNEWGADTVYKSTVDILAVFAHEYGHSVFDNHLGKAIPLHNELKKIKAEISDLGIKSIRSPLNDDQLKEIAAQIKAKEKSITDNKKFLDVMWLTMPYGELFADTVAVFETQNKAAIFNALFNPNIPRFRNSSYDYVASRDFGVPHDINTWSIDEEHALFAPLRSVIGSEQCWPTTEAARAQKLKQLSALLISDILEKQKAGKKARVEDNRALMKKYQELCK